MYNTTDLSKISQITSCIYLSGIFPLDENYQKIKELNIKYILCCVDRSFISEVHDRILADNPNLTILYLPYNDDLNQNLWEINRYHHKPEFRGSFVKQSENQINLVKYAGSTEAYDKILQQLNYYNNKPMIEIGYNFINNAVEEKSNILVHCMAGISRSASLVIYFLMKKYHFGYYEAEKIVKDRRQIINPNICFKSQLLAYQDSREKLTEADTQNIINSLKSKMIRFNEK